MKKLVIFDNKDIAFLFSLIFFSSLPLIYSLSCPLLEGWDDHIYVVNNTKYLHVGIENIIYWLKTPCEGCYLPLTMFSYMFDYAVWGMNGFGYHLQNLFWHLTATTAVYFFFQIIGIERLTALLCSLFFSLHPQRVESVVWVSERKDVLCAAFYVWSLVLFLVSTREKISKNKRIALYATSILFAIFAILSKPMAVSIPFIMFLSQIYVEKGIKKTWLIKLTPFFIIALIFIPITVVFQDIPAAHQSLLKRSIVMMVNIPWYFVKIFLPFNLSPIYSRIVMTVENWMQVIFFYAIFLPCSLIYLWKNRESEKLFKYIFIICFLVSLLPVSGIVPLGAIDYADRYSYIPSVFIIAFCGIILDMFLCVKGYGRKIILAILSLYLLILALITHFYSFSWSSYRSLLESAGICNPPAYIALGALADLEFFSGNYHKVVEICQKIEKRNPGWESKSGLDRIILKANILEIRSYLELGEKENAYNTAIKTKKSIDKITLKDDKESEKINKYIDEVVKNLKQGE